MKIRLGLSGVKDTLAVLESVAKEFEEFECIPFLHTTEDELLEQLISNDHRVDMWLFSGKMIYKVKDEASITTPSFYVSYTGSSLYRTLYIILNEKSWTVDQLSFDIIDLQELKQVFEEIGVTPENILLCEETQRVDSIVDYHEKLWAQGKTVAAVTCIWGVKRELEKRGIPVFRVIPTKSSVRSTLYTALRTYEMLRFREMQTAVQFIELNLEKEIQKDYFSPYEMHNAELKLFQKLLDYAMQLQGSLKSMGNGRFAIFTTRGMLTDKTTDFQRIPDLPSVDFLVQEKATIGIGVGLTAYNAEVLAGKALAHAKHFKTGSWFAMTEDGGVIGPIGEKEQVVLRSSAPHLEQIAKDTGLSEITLHRLEEAMRTYGVREVNAYELAEYMQIIPRSARRILSALEEAHYATCVSYDKMTDRGRPRKKYKIDIAAGKERP
ncbi:ArsR family transcriptional regulator [Brevibacillus sp. NRS-1366]|uniref:ArsR family transcriptional regulator n=1 Tax=Brevibacillus sp. NRS-1366 TaxID=3233899 RepID=UPI003D2199F9